GDLALRAIISMAMLGMALFLSAQPTFGEERVPTTAARRTVGYLVAAVWAVYGGLFSGGYATVLTLMCVSLFGCLLMESVALTKLVNFAGSAAATVVFAALGSVEWRAGVTLSVAMLVGGWLGAGLALVAGVGWVRRLFVIVVALLALKLLIDVFRAR